MLCENVKLSSLVDIKTGAPLSRAKKIGNNDTPYEVRVLTPAAMSGDRVDDSQLTTEVVSHINDDLFTRETDIVVKTTTPYNCVYIDKNYTGLLVTSFGLILRPHKGSKVDTRYLAAFLELKQTNQKLQAMSTGMGIQLIKKKDVEELMVPIPSQKELRYLSALFESTQRRKKLCRSIAHKSDLLLHSEFDRVINTTD